VGTTKYSEQNHNPKEKEFKLKAYSRLKGHESFSEYDSKTVRGITLVLASRPFVGVEQIPYLLGLGISPPASYHWSIGHISVTRVTV
jgi:hypothetical protein